MQFMKLYYMEMDVVKSWNEIIKSYSFQVWPKFEELKFEVFSQDFWLECLLQVWWWLKKQTLLSQIVISVLSILGLFFLVTSFYVKLTKGVCKSKARLDGKTVLITGANSGLLSIITYLSRLGTTCSVVGCSYFFFQNCKLCIF